MKAEIIKIYTKSGTLDNVAEIMETIQNIKKSYTGFNYEPLVEYICRQNNKNYLLELNIPTSEVLEMNPDAEMDISIYTFDADNIEDYSADDEIDIIPLNASINFKTIIDYMKDLVLNLEN